MPRQHGFQKEHFLWSWSLSSPCGSGQGSCGAVVILCSHIPCAGVRHPAAASGGCTPGMGASGGRGSPSPPPLPGICPTALLFLLLLLKGRVLRPPLVSLELFLSRCLTTVIWVTLPVGGGCSGGQLRRARTQWWFQTRGAFSTLHTPCPRQRCRRYGCLFVCKQRHSTGSGSVRHLPLACSPEAAVRVCQRPAFCLSLGLASPQVRQDAARTLRAVSLPRALVGGQGSRPRGRGLPECSATLPPSLTSMSGERLCANKA